MITSILIATDGSEVAQAALSWSAQVARRRGARLEVLHAASLRQAELDPETFESRCREAKAHLDEWIAAEGADDVVDERTIEIGRADDVIAQRAEATSPDLLVLGARGSGGFTSLGLGSTVHQLAHIHRGVLATVHDRANITDQTQVIVGVDGSDGSSEALRWALSLSERLNTRPLAVSVHDALADSYPHPNTGDWKYQHQGAVERQLAGIGQPVELRLEAGNAVEALAAVATEFESSLLVVGTRSHGLATHRFLGRVPMELLHHSRRPVVLVPAP